MPTVAAAEAVLEQAWVALADMELLASFAGTVASPGVKVGECLAMA
jgi:multidrug resistance efflux pump